MPSEKPKYLYRGITISYEQLESFNFKGKDLEVPYEPIIDEQGRKTVTDGNEYGVYMTDNETMVSNAYGDVHGGGTPVREDVKIGSPAESIKLPDIGITYKINTEGMDVHEPWISSSMQGHYNNGYQGKEYIAERVPAKNYTISKIKIGRDMLHDEEEIEVNSIEDAENKVKSIMKERKERLEVFAEEMSKIPEAKRRTFTRDEKEALKDIYGKDGAKYINEDNLNVSNPDNAIQYLMAKTYKKDPDALDIKTLTYIESIKSRMNMGKRKDEFESIEAIILSDILEQNSKKEKFIGTKEAEGEIPNTKSYDSRIDMMKELHNILKEKENIKEYLIEERENRIDEKFAQILTDYSGNEIGTRTVTDRFETETGAREVLTTGEITNEDGKYEFKEMSKCIGVNLQYLKKEMSKDNALTGQKEQFIFEKDENGNEMYCRVADGKTTFRIIKDDKGTTIENYDANEEISDVFTYDENGNAVLGIEGMDKIDADYIENFYDSQMPYFEAKMKPITEKEAFAMVEDNPEKIEMYNKFYDLQEKANNGELTEEELQFLTDTAFGKDSKESEEVHNALIEKLNKETVEEQKNGTEMDKVQEEIEKEMRSRESDEEKSFKDEAVEEVKKEKNSFKENLRQELSSEEYAEMLIKQYEKDLEEGKLEDELTEEQKKKLNHKVEKGDNDYIDRIW